MLFQFAIVVVIGQFCLCSTTNLLDPCTEVVLGKLYGQIKRIHSSKMVILKESNHSEPDIIAKLIRKPQGGIHEVVASSLDIVLDTSVRPRTKFYFARSQGESPFEYLARGEGIETFKGTRGPCLHEFDTSKLVSIVALEYLHNIKKPSKLDLSPTTITSVAYTHLIHQILGSFDHRGGKNCFFDANGKAWAIDFDISNVSLAFKENTKGTLLQCLQGLVRHQNDTIIRCSVLDILQSKLNGLDLTQVERDLMQLLKINIPHGVYRMPKGGNASSCIKAFRFPSFVSDCYMFNSLTCLKMGFTPDRMLSFVATNNYTLCDINLPFLWSKILRLRLQEITYKLNMSSNDCH